MWHSSMLCNRDPLKLLCQVFLAVKRIVLKSDQPETCHVRPSFLDALGGRPSSTDSTEEGRGPAAAEDARALRR